MKIEIDRAFKEAISNSVFPSADVLAAKSGEIVYEGRFGDAREHTCFDIASLTKPIATATLTMMLVADGLLRLEDNVYQWLAGARQAAHKEILISNLLDHTSGLPTWQPYFRELPENLIGTSEGKRFMLDSIYVEPLLESPGAKTLYSDLGYILLGEILEQAGGSSIDKLFNDRIAKPLDLTETFFIHNKGLRKNSSHRSYASADQHVPTPKHGLVSERAHRKGDEHFRFAPTEDCPWRGRVVHGEVHDQNAYALGGVAGHAGLFSTAHNIHRFLKELVACYSGKSSWINNDTIRLFLKESKKKPVGDEYCLGWNRPSKRNSASGHYFSANTIGHLGYTGCSVWVDLALDAWIVLLTNRIHPSTTNQKITSFRPMIHDLIYQGLF